MVPPNAIVLLIVVAIVSPAPAAASGIFPCIPGLPKISFLPCYDPSPPLTPPTPTNGDDAFKPKECWTPLRKMSPCSDFLTTNSTASAPTQACCDGFRSVADSGAGVCYCHVAKGNMGWLLTAPMNFTRMFSLTKTCDVHLPLEEFAKYCNVKDTPPVTPPSPSPPPSPLTPPGPDPWAPKDCWAPLIKMKPCADFITTNSTAAAPTQACCDGFRSIADSGAGLCYCHVAKGNMDWLLHAPMNFTRMFSLTTTCNVYLRLEPFAQYCSVKDSPPITPASPPTTTPAGNHH